jgi:hypothetical protein
MVKTVPYEHLRTVLTALGYTPQSTGDARIVYRHPERRLVIVLPELRDRETVRPIDMLRVQKTLVNDGVVDEAGFDALFRINKGDRLILTDPKTGAETRVTAAAGESDGMVVIEQKGAFMACPVDSLRKEEVVMTDVNGRH